MTIGGKIRHEKLQYDINREAAKVSALSSRKIDKYECLTGEGIFPYDQSRMIEKSEFTYSALRKALEKQTKTIVDQGEKQRKALEEHRKKQVEALQTFKHTNRKLIVAGAIPDDY